MATYQSLYRRYRPQRFDEVLGQDHVSRALRNAVREGRVGHAYLFSGPRGTGKTSTARILAKVLNCADPADGEPCGVCENCVAVAEGRVTDWLLEQDAASKSKVDDMRDLLERVPLGTSGNRKVIILDEVHMLSQGAENALLKTLEEPPEHVVFVLATTDPQKVRPTIRSRTQHFEFRLLPPDVMAAHVRAVIGDAELGLDDDAVDHVVRSGGGSARDTLSALDQVAALGEVVDDAEPIGAIVDALCDRDAGAVLLAVADALASGRDPRTLGEALIGNLRNAFLAVMGAADVHLAAADRERAATVGERLGPAGLTRALEVLGEALTELARKPDPRIVVEVALVRLTRPDTDRTVDALLERVDRLERGMPAGGGAGGVAPAAPAVPATPAVPGPAGEGTGAAPAAAPAPAPAPAPAHVPGGGQSAASARAALAEARGPGGRPSGDAGGAAEALVTPPPAGGAGSGAGAGAGSGKPTLGAVARAGGSGKPTLGSVARSATAAPPPEPQEAPAQPEPPADPAPPSPAPAAAAPVAAGDVPSTGELVPAWDGQILSTLAIPIRSKWRAGRWIEPAGGAARFAVPNEWHQKVCDDTRRDVEQVLSDHFGRKVSVVVVVDGAAASGAPGPGGPAGGGPSGGPSAGGGPAGTSGGGSGGGPARSAAPSPGPSAPPPDDHDEHIDPSELRDAGDITTGGVDLLMREFGGQLVEEER
jgi:DNA polymerase-3 subunit gamma/tau